MQPASSGASIRVREDQHIETRLQSFYADAKIVDLLCATLGLFRDDHVGLWLRLLGYPFSDDISGIGGRSDQEKDLIILVLEFRERQQIALESWLQALARAEHRHSRRVKPRIREHAPPRVTQPLQSVSDQIESQKDLHEGQAIEDSFHV